MDFDHGTAKQIYIQLLSEVLNKKTKVLEQMLELTLQQEGTISSEPFEEELFLQSIHHKEELLKELDGLDQGFEQIYGRVKEELEHNRYIYRKEIAGLQEQILYITDLTVKIQATEKRNKSKLDLIFATKRKSIKNSKMSSQMATNYYKTMANQYEVPSIFYDKKK